MANRQSLIGQAARTGMWSLRQVGRELRVARLTAGLRQRDVGDRLHRSASHVSRVEHGLIAGVSLPQLHTHAAIVGLKPYVRLYPAVARPLDRPQLMLLTRFRERLGAGWRVVLEAPVPIRGDLRAADAMISLPGCRIVVEAITRLADLQAQVRAARHKARDLSADRMIFVVAATETNRRAVRDAGAAAWDAFPVGSRECLRALAASRDPGGDALLFLSLEDDRRGVA